MSQLVQRITAAYQKDLQRKSAQVFSATELPFSYDAITNEWLTDVLCRGHGGAAVVAHRLDAPDNGSSNRRRVYVEYNEAGRKAGLPQALFCKASHELANRIVLGVAGSAFVEALFYNDIRPLLDIEAPRSVFARFDPDTYNSMIMLGDLTAEVTEFCDHTTRMTRSRAESQLAVLATVHGQCYSDKSLIARCAPLMTWPQFFQSTLEFGMKEGSSKGFLAAETVIPSRLYQRFEEIWPATLASVQRHDQLPGTLAHGDVHLKNWYVARNGGMGLTDWQCASRGHWGRDFAYTLSTALTTEDRRAWERDLLRFYLDRLRAAGGPDVTFDEALTHYRQQLLSSLTWWTITLAPTPDIPDMQPREITLEFIRRISTAIDDLDSLAAFG